MWQGAEQEVLTEDKLLNGPPLIGGMVHQDVRKDRNARQGIGDVLGVFRFEVEKLALMANELEPEWSKVGGVIFVTRNERGEEGFVVRPEVRAALEPVKEVTDVGEVGHGKASCTGCAESLPVAV